MKVPRYKSSGGGLAKARPSRTTANTTQLANLNVWNGENAIKFGDELIDREAKLDAEVAKMNNENQKIQANNMSAQNIADANDKLAGITDPEEIQKVTDELKAKNLNDSSIIKDGNTRNTWNLNNQKNLISASSKFKNNARATLGSNYTKNLNNTYKNTIISAVDTGNPLDAYVEMSDTLNAGLDNNYLDKEYVDEKIESWQQEVKVKSLALETKKNPEAIDAALKDTESALSKSLNDKERVTAKADVTKALKTVETNKKKAVLALQHATFQAYTDLISSGEGSTILPSEIDEQVRAELLTGNEGQMVKDGVIEDANAKGLPSSALVALRLARSDAVKSGWFGKEPTDEGKNKYYALLTDFKLRGYEDEFKMTDAEYKLEMNQYASDRVELKMSGKNSQEYMSDIIRNAVNTQAWNYQEAANKVYDEMYASQDKPWGDTEIQEALSRHLPGYADKLDATKKEIATKEAQAPLSDEAKEFSAKWLGEESNG